MAEIENSLEDFLDRFDVLQQQAKGYGLGSLVVIVEDDPLGDSTQRGVSRVGISHLVMGGIGGSLVDEANRALRLGDVNA